MKPSIRSEVDIQVAQELQNHKNFMYDTRQDINDLHKKLDDVKQLYKDFTASMLSGEVAMVNRIDYITAKNVDSNKKSLKILDEYRSKIESESMLIEGFVNGLDEKYVNWAVYLKAIPQIQSKIEIMEKEINELKRLISEQGVNLSKLCDAKIKASKEEILSMPTEIPEIKQSIKEQFHLMKMDLDNARIRAINNDKQLIVIEKKIEQIYLLIKQLELK